MATIKEALAQQKRNGVWGTCVSCPRKGGTAYPEECVHFGRYDHQLKADELQELCD